HDVIILQEDDSPAVIEDVSVVPSGLGVPGLVRVTVRNRSDQPIQRLIVDTMWFNEKRKIQNQGGRMSRQLLPAGGSIVEDFRLTNVSAKSSWRVVVAVKEATTQHVQWSNQQVSERAKAAVLEAP